MWRETMAEWVLLAHSSLFLITESGFSKTAALSSVASHPLYVVRKRGMPRENCKPERPTKLVELAVIHSRL